MTRLLSVLLLLALSACTPMVAPLGIEEAPLALQETAYLTRDGLRLPLRHWGDGHPKAVIVALHGMGDYANAFDMPATWWAMHGIDTYAYDQRGFGNAPYLGLWPGGDALRGDARDFLALVRAKYPGVPVFALGASMGGAVLLSALPDGLDADGVILVAPAVWSRGDMPWLYRMALWLSVHTAPDAWLTGKGLKIWPSDNIPMLRAYARDLLVHKRTRADAVWGLVDLMDEARAAPAHLVDPPPILLLYGAHDQIVPAEPTEAVIAALGGRVEAHRFPDGYHMLLRDLHAEAVWRTVDDWIEKKTKEATILP